MKKGTTGTHARTRTSFKLLTGIWLLSMVVLVNAYSGVLTSLLTVPKLKPIARTLKDVADNKELKVTVEKNGVFDVKLLVVSSLRLPFYVYVSN
jgi:ionotropic glutamate receptor